MPDVLKHLIDADPAGGGDAGPPDAARLHAVLAQVRRDTSPAVVTRRRVSPRVGVLAGAGLASLGAAALVLSGGPEAHPVDAQAAVVHAAQALPDATQGLVVLDTQAVSDRDGTVFTSSHEELRFAGSDVDAIGRTADRRESDGQRVETELPEARFVDGNLYMKGIRPNVPGWGRLVGAPASGPQSAAAMVPAWTKASDPQAAVALVSALTGVQQDASVQGVTTYRGDITVDALKRTWGAIDPGQVEALTAHADQDLGPIRVTAQVGGSGRLQRLSIAHRTPWTHPTEASVTMTSTIDYTGLGQAQQIAAPTDATDIAGEEPAGSH
ncbi:MAG TPA: hypothetical protein VGM33_07730 [Baekduia sp.]|jgi:hypothetical protein